MLTRGLKVQSSFWAGEVRARSPFAEAAKKKRADPELTNGIYLAAATFMAESANSDSFWSVCFSSSSVV